MSYSSVIGDGLKENTKNTKELYIDGYKLDGWAMSQRLPQEDITFDGSRNLK